MLVVKREMLTFLLTVKMIMVLCLLQGTLEALIGIGLMVGPAMAGVLYDVSCIFSVASFFGYNQSNHIKTLIVGDLCRLRIICMMKTRKSCLENK